MPVTAFIALFLVGPSPPVSGVESIHAFLRINSLLIAYAFLSGR